MKTQVGDFFNAKGERILMIVEVDYSYSRIIGCQKLDYDGNLLVVNYSYPEMEMDLERQFTRDKIRERYWNFILRTSKKLMIFPFHPNNW